MARTHSFASAYCGALTIFLLTSLVLQPYAAHASLSHDSTRSKHHRLSKRAAYLHPADKSNGWSFIPKGHLSEEELAALSGSDESAGITTNSTISTSSKRTAAAAAAVSPWAGTGKYEQLGTSGVSAMQLSVVNDQFIVIFDRAEHNPLKTSDGNPAWAAMLDTHAHTVRALKTTTNSFCAGE